jgi:transcriptional regulator with XRE-family HTH domain
VAKRDDLLRAFGCLIRDHRQEQDRTQAEVAEILGITQPSYSAYETGDALPTVPILLALLRELDIPLSAVMALLPDHDGEPGGGEVAA